jgi:hypothetical protein
VYIYLTTKKPEPMKRRKFIQASMLSGVGIIFAPNCVFGQKYPPAVAITTGQKNHWFGYYDKFQIDPSGRYALGCQVNFEGRSPVGEDRLRIGLIDLKAGSSWTEIGTSSAWGWQQSCMLQWIPGSHEEIIWNDREGDSFVSRIYNFKTGERRTLPKPIYALSPDGKFAIGTEFNRIQNLRPGYGYAGIKDPFERIKAPEPIGLYRMDLQTGEQQLLVSIADLAKMPHLGENVENNWHWFNHLLVSPDSKRLLFLHRWRPEILDTQTMARTGFVTRMITCDILGKDIYVVDPSGNSSHFVWRDPKHLFVWTKPVGQKAGFWLLQDKSENMELVGEEVMKRNGHNTYVPNTNNEWVLNDTYPDKNREMILYLYHIPTNRQVILGKFYSPPEYVSEWRCDLHPRCNQQGTKVYFDSTHEKGGRQIYELDISNIIGQI